MAGAVTGYAIWAVTSEDLQGGRVVVGVVAFAIAAGMAILAVLVLVAAKRR